MQANKENLSLLVVVKDDAMHALEVRNKNYIHCVTNNDVPIPVDCIIREVELKGLFFSLIESGVNGLCFSTDKVLVGFEWKDLFRSPASSQEESGSAPSKAPMEKKAGRKDKKNS